MKRKIALLAGGYTGESVISVQSAKLIQSHLDPDKYDVYLIYIDKNKWTYTDPHGLEVPVDRNNFSINLQDGKVQFEAVFIAIHGTPGEDGKLQGYFDMIGIPYSTCDASTSALTMNKVYTKAVVSGIPGLHIAPAVHLFKTGNIKILEGLKYPLFIKPNTGGSSIGMSRVAEPSTLLPALEKAFLEDDQLIAEEFIPGREFTVGVVRLNGNLEVLPITEVISSREFFDYEAKYTPGVSSEITPADLEPGKVEEIGLIVQEIYKRLNGAGVVRIDFILEEKSGKFYFLEVNTIPGQSENSIIPQQVRAAGKDLRTFYGALIEECLRAR